MIKLVHISGLITDLAIVEHDLYIISILKIFIVKFNKPAIGANCNLGVRHWTEDFKLCKSNSCIKEAKKNFIWTA